MLDNEEIYIEEESGDKRYFTIIPNSIMDDTDAQELSVYAHLKRFAGEKNTAFPSQKTLMKKLSMSKPTLIKILERLEMKDWIRFIGLKEVSTKGGMQKVNHYSLVDIWGSNSRRYDKTEGVKNSTTSKGVKINAKGGKKYASKGVKNRPTKYNHLSRSNEEDVAEKPATDKKPLKDDGNNPMDRVEFVKWCRASPLRHIQLIAEYADEKKIDFNTKEQWREFIKRNVRAARILSPYTDEQIAKAMAQIEKATQGERGYITRWTMETLVKYLDQ